MMKFWYDWLYIWYTFIQTKYRIHPLNPRFGVFTVQSKIWFYFVYYFLMVLCSEIYLLNSLRFNYWTIG